MRWHTQIFAHVIHDKQWIKHVWTVDFAERHKDDK